MIGKVILLLVFMLLAFSFFYGVVIMDEDVEPLDLINPIYHFKVFSEAYEDQREFREVLT